MPVAKGTPKSPEFKQLMKEIWLNKSPEALAKHSERARRQVTEYWKSHKKTHCPHGHELTPENTKVIIQKKGPYRACRICRRIQAKAKYYRLRYGITQDQKWDLLKQQNGCAICHCSEPRGFGKKDKNGWHVDHIHGSRVVRGILCARCNLILGTVEADIEVAKKMIDYIEKHKAINS